MPRDKSWEYQPSEEELKSINLNLIVPQKNGRLTMNP